jgi:hypothetical protein
MNKQANDNNNNTPGKIMRIIRGGDGKDYNSNQNYFFGKMLNNGMDTKFKSENKKINLDRFRKAKYEQEMNILDNDNFNNSKDSDILDIQTEAKKTKTPTKDRGGLLNFFSKIISSK